jgi:hypothetical protein
MIQAKLRTLLCHFVLEVGTCSFLRESNRGAIMATDIELITSGDDLQPNQGLEHSLRTGRSALRCRGLKRISINLTNDTLLTLTSERVNNNYQWSQLM